MIVNGKVVGTVTSGDWGYRTDMNLAYAFVDPELSGEGTTIQIDMYGDLVNATVIAPSPYNPDYSLMRG